MEKYFENKLTYNQITFHLTDKPTVDEREIHPYHEILLYIEGNAQLLTSRGRHALKNRSIIIIPEDTYHFLNTGEVSGFTRLKISFSSKAAENIPLSGIMKELRIIEDSGAEIKFVFDRLCRIMASREEHASFYAYSAFLMLISELNISAPGFGKTVHPTLSQFMTALTDYISENISDKLDINSLAKAMHISPSGITHLFKKEFGIPIHKYIIQKRLVYAKKLISEGKQPTKIYADAGFMDYSTFYKAYINHFGYPPSKENEKNAHL